MNTDETFMELIKRQAQIDNLKILNAELLEALKGMVILGENERVRETNLAMIKARAAIAKARQ